MEGIKIYTIDSKKMIKKGFPGWNPHQEQAKIYYSSIAKDDKCYKVQISDDNLINKLFRFTSISEEERILNIDDHGILISIRYISDDKYCMISSLPAFCNSDYMIAENLETKEKVYVLRDFETGIITDVTADYDKAVNIDQAQRNIREILYNNGY